jgi:hypothetical protein
MAASKSLSPHGRSSSPEDVTPPCPRLSTMGVVHMLGARHLLNRTLRACVGSRALRCGCRVGLYETYAGKVVAVLDVKDGSCQEPAHQENRTVDLTDPAASSNPTRAAS